MLDRAPARDLDPCTQVSSSLFQTLITELRIALLTFGFAKPSTREASVCLRQSLAWVIAEQILRSFGDDIRIV